ncbi:hypothetical protein L6258_01415 [Candidatus Parcubacteria bacterium]|nr:hypothetical protein [Candidatus Parcubacteria bacterium]
MLKTRTLAELKEVLQNPQASGPEEVYFMLRGQPNITVLVPGKIGEEFTKTYGHYHKHGGAETYQILFGRGLLLLQKKGADDEELEDICLREVGARDTIEVPKGYGHVMINVGSTFLVTADNAPTNAETSQNDYEPIKKLRGFSYYIVDDGEGGWKAVRNEKYVKVPKLEVSGAN